MKGLSRVGRSLVSSRIATNRYLSLSADSYVKLLHLLTSASSIERYWFPFLAKLGEEGVLLTSSSDYGVVLVGGLSSPL